MSKITEENDLLVVGLGASAGGLEALKAFFNSVFEHSGMAFIVIVHLSPKHKSSMAELLQMQTSMKVMQVEDKVEIEEDHVYVIPPDKILSMGDNHLQLSNKKREKQAVIDLFFRSLGKSKKRKCVSIVLSGSGNDGSVGLKTVKEEGGMAIVQDPREAKYAGMPQSAIDTGLVDKVLPVKKMAEELQRYKKNLFSITVSDNIDDLEDGDTQTVETILSEVKAKTNHDFNDYKRSSVLRRIKRRMQVNQLTSLSDYHSYIEEKPEEIEELFKDLLISVTNFFRDDEAFHSLKQHVIPKLFEDKNKEDQLRIWIPGCATGEEAYSIAMLLTEYSRNVTGAPDIQLFATDIDKTALKVARTGRYPASITADLSSHLLNRYFIKDGTEYQVKSELSNKILFAAHNLLKDPPFSKLDLISCRNLLIYLNRKLQSQVFDLFHYALASKGWLFLGQSDSSLEATDLFTPSDKKHQIYRKKATSDSDFHIPELPSKFGSGGPPASTGTPNATVQPTSGFEELHRELMMRRHVPPSVIISDEYDVLHSVGPIDKYLKYAGGKPSRNLLDMIVSELKQPLRNVLFQAKKDENSFPLHKQVQFNKEDEVKYLEIMVHTVKDKNLPDGLMHVVFKEGNSSAPAAAKELLTEGASDEENEIIDALEKELDYTKEQLQITVEDYQTSNEELRASNEELQSMNEELQSTTEELETSKEELQSVNEELKTVNEELEGKIEKLHRSNNDLKNLMEATEIGTIFIDREYCVKRFTSSVSDIFNLIQSDVGRPLEHVTNNLLYDSILDDINQVLDKLNKVKKVVTDKNGRRFNMKISPYRTTEEKIEGVVITFVDITDLQNAQQKLKQRAVQQEALAKMGLFTLKDNDLLVIEDHITNYVCEVLDVDYCLLLKFDHKKERFVLTASSDTFNRGKELKVKEAKKWGAVRMLEHKKPLVIDDYNEEKRFIKNPLLNDAEIQSGVTVAVKSAEKMIGVMEVYSKRQRNFTDTEVNFVQVTANLTGEAIERKKAADELKASNKQLEDKIEQNKQLQREILKTSANERWKIGQYLHDGLAQVLVAAGMMVNNLEKELEKEDVFLSEEINKIKETLQKASKSARELSHEVVPVNIERDGASYAFYSLIKQMEDSYKINCELVGTDTLKKLKDSELITNLYLIAQEAVKNAVVHGEAEHVKITLKLKDGDIYQSIEDDGLGFKDTKNKEDGLGINIMRHRVELLEGTFKITESTSFGESGVKISCIIPLT